MSRQCDSRLRSDSGEVGICCHPQPVAHMTSAVAKISHGEKEDGGYWQWNPLGWF